LQERGIQDVNFDSVITTAEVLLPGQRELLEKAFHARVFNRYGCREVSVIASECEYHQGMHVNAEALLLEIVSDASVPASAGKIVVTDLLNYNMPLIRYEIGDVGRWSERSECPCGRGLPLLDDVQGRITDFLLLQGGQRISGPALTLTVADMPDVRQIQFLQKSLQAIILRVVPGKNYGPHTEEELRRRLNLYLKGLTSLHVETVERITSERSGKYRFVINEVDRISLNRHSTTFGEVQVDARA
jgi:phenylacetate-CoA ligase